MPGQFELADYDRAADFVRSQTGRHEAQLTERRLIGLVLGSGLNALAASVEDAVAIPYGAIPHFPTSTVMGHEGRLIVGRLAGQAVVAMQGRIHLYEGYSAEEITFPIRVMRRLGVETLVLTNAAGGLNPEFLAGDLMLIVDHLNFRGHGWAQPSDWPQHRIVRGAFPFDDGSLCAGYAAARCEDGPRAGHQAAPGRVRVSGRPQL